jgi:hypothetical protein
MGRAHLHSDTGRHLPEILAFEQFDHAQRQNLLVLLPVLHRDLSADGNVGLMFAVLYPLPHFAVVGTRLRSSECRQYRDQHERCEYTHETLHGWSPVVAPRGSGARSG